MEEQVRRAEEEWVAAAVARDERALVRVLREDFLFTSSVSVGGVQGRAQYLDFVLNVLTVISGTFADFRVRRYGEVALVNTRYHQVGKLFNDQWEAEFLLSDVWVLTGGVWQAAARHSSQPLTV